MSAAAFDFNIFEQYKNLERSGMAEPIAHAVKDFVFAAHQAGNCVANSDFREYKAKQTGHLEKLKIGQDRAFDQLRHEIKETKHEIKSEIDSKIENLKNDMIKWMVSLFFAQASLTTAVITCIKIFG